MKRQLTFLFLLFALTQMCLGQENKLLIEKTEDFNLDGAGSNAAWDKANWVLLTARDGAKQDYETKAKVLYSATGIYFLFLCEDHKITATLQEDFADLYEEDVVEVFFWTDEAYPFYFEYELSPLNYELPIFVPNVEGEFMGWRPWHYEGDRKTRHAVHIEEKDGHVQYWTGEFFIPFALLKPMANVPPESGTIWRANMYRIDYDGGTTYWNWSAIRTNYHDYERFGWFEFR